MCEVSRRAFLAGSAAVLSRAAEAELRAEPNPHPSPEVGKVDPVASEIYFHEGLVSDTADAVCNNGWIIFDDYVLVIEANFPAGAKEVIGKIRAVTSKPVRFTLDTHHHGDHAYGNEVFAESGAVPFAHTGVIEEMKRYETGYYDGTPGSWEKSAKGRADVRASKLKPPTVLYSGLMVFDDGKHRVEIMNLGVAHTHGDSFAWLPKEKILFTGDACVNGPYNYVGDGDVGRWIGTLDAARKLGAEIVCPGHGPRGAASVLRDQQAFFRILQDQVGQLMIGKSPAEAKAQMASIRETLMVNSQVARYVGEYFPAQVEKVYQEMTGSKLSALGDHGQSARHAHAHSHGVAAA